MPGFPRLRCGRQDGVFNRQRTCGSEKGVNAIGIGVQHGPGVTAADLVIGFRRPFKAEGAHEAVFDKAIGTGKLRPAPKRTMPVVVHMPQPILRGDKSLGKKGIVFGCRLDVRDSPAVADNVDRLLQTGHGEGRRHIGKCGLKVCLGDTLGHAASIITSCFGALSLS